MKKPNLISSWKQKAQDLKIQTFALYFAYRDPRVPWYAKVFTALVVAYAFSPIDLIPDFIPILGYLDDLVLIPLGVSLAIRMIPAPIMLECRQKAEENSNRGGPQSKIMAAIIIGIWILAILWAGTLVVNWLRP